MNLLLKLRARLESLAGIQDSGVDIQYNEKNLNEKYKIQTESGDLYLVRTEGAIIDTINIADSSGMWPITYEKFDAVLRMMENNVGVTK